MNQAAPLVSNSGYFGLSLEKPGNSDEFQIRIRRKDGPGYNGDGKIAYAFEFGLSGAPALVVNNSTAGVMYMKSGDTEEKLYKDIVVVRFCIHPSCPDYVD
ncbi:MAG: hypothetical protein LBO65_07510 [Spirochaetaceae bacterium]|jgi:hypothetical protein|nr:hypothetical protein [Spirochaetaceae bacterium]